MSKAAIYLRDKEYVISSVGLRCVNICQLKPLNVLYFYQLTDKRPLHDTKS